MAIAPVKHPYIVRDKKICGGVPIIAGSRISVRSIILYYKNGISPEEIIEGLPHLTLSQIFDALSYYHDHREEIERDIELHRKFDENRE